MNGQQGDFDVSGYMSYPNFMGMAEGNETDHDNIGVVFGDYGQTGGNTRRHVRHTPEQIQELENFYKECPNPSVELKSELARTLNLEPKQIKNWFQNKRAQLKRGKMNGQEGAPYFMGRAEDAPALRSYDISSLFASPPEVQPSSSSLGIANPGTDAPTEEHDSFLNDLLVSVSTATPSSPVMMIPNPGSDALSALDPSLNDLLISPSTTQPSSPAMISSPGIDAPTKIDLLMNELSTMLFNPSDTQPTSDALPEIDAGGENSTISRQSLLELASVAMNELIMLGQSNSPFWRIDSSSKRETLNYEKYRSFFNKGLVKPPGYVVEASRETGSVFMDSLALVETLTTDKWVSVFAPIVSVASIPTGSGGPTSGSLIQIEAEFQVISPLMPKRQVKFLRYCQMIKLGLWVVVDFTPRQENLNWSSGDGSSRLPSGVIIEDCFNGYSNVTWIEQTEYNESQIPQLYQLLISSGIGLGAKRWFTTLQRYCKNLSTLSTINLNDVYQGLSSKVASEIVKLAQHMTINYYSCITATPGRKWKTTYAENERQNMRLMTRKKVNSQGEHTGVVLSAATSAWFPVSKKRMFNFLSNISFRNEWDILTNDGTPVQENIKIRKSTTHGNYISFLQIDSDLSLLQETWNDASGALVVYAPLDTSSMEQILRGNSVSVQILPSGFSILPDGGEETPGRTIGCLLTFGCQILASVQPTADIDQDIVREVEGLMDNTISRIKSTLLL